VLSNLGDRYSAAGRHPEAVATTEEAVELYRGLATADPVFLDHLTWALRRLDSVRAAGAEPLSGQ
jgi:hypothetical protein